MSNIKENLRSILSRENAEYSIQHYIERNLQPPPGHPYLAVWQQHMQRQATLQPLNPSLPRPRVMTSQQSPNNGPPQGSNQGSPSQQQNIAPGSSGGLVTPPPYIRHQRSASQSNNGSGMRGQHGTPQVSPGQHHPWQGQYNVLGKPMNAQGQGSPAVEGMVIKELTIKSLLDTPCTKQQMIDATDMIQFRCPSLHNTLRSAKAIRQDLDHIMHIKVARRVASLNTIMHAPHPPPLHIIRPSRETYRWMDSSSLLKRTHGFSHAP
jgi:hypothetical protein